MPNPFRNRDWTDPVATFRAVMAEQGTPLAAPQNASKCPDLPQNAPKCPIADANLQNEPTEDESELTPRQMSAINLLFAGAPFAQVCRQLHIDRKTLYRWRHSEIFIAEVRRRYREHGVARKPASRGDPIIPPRAAPAAPAAPPVAAAPDPRERYWDLLSAAIQLAPEMPPVEPDEPFWIKVLRQSRAARDSRATRAAPTASDAGR